MNWTQRHLNWSYTLGLFICWSLLAIIIISINISTSGNTWAEDATLAVFLGYLCAILALSVWLIKAKDRSLWNLLWFLTGFGIWIMLGLSNREQLANDRLKQEEYKKAQIEFEKRQEEYKKQHPNWRRE